MTQAETTRGEQPKATRPASRIVAMSGNQTSHTQERGHDYAEPAHSPAHAAYLKLRASVARSCDCGHGWLAHGPTGCEGFYTELDDAEPGPCYCQKAVGA